MVKSSIIENKDHRTKQECRCARENDIAINVERCEKLLQQN